MLSPQSFEYSLSKIISVQDVFSQKISGYPENAVNWAMEKLSTEERSNIQQTLSKLEQFLGEKPKKTTTSRRLPSNAELFEKHILLIIKDGVKKLEKVSMFMM